jgi:hypothetical protein
MADTLNSNYCDQKAQQVISRVVRSIDVAYKDNGASARNP